MNNYKKVTIFRQIFTCIWLRDNGRTEGGKDTLTIGLFHEWHLNNLYLKAEKESNRKCYALI